MQEDDKMMQFLAASVAAGLSVDEVIDRLGADPVRGLDEARADRRLRVHGPNEFEISKEEPLWQKYLGQVRVKTVGLNNILIYSPNYMIM